MGQGEGLEFDVSFFRVVNKRWRRSYICELERTNGEMVSDVDRIGHEVTN